MGVGGTPYGMQISNSTSRCYIYNIVQYMLFKMKEVNGLYV